MVDQLSVYLVEALVFGDPTPNKSRPAIFFNYEEGDIWLLGIYSVRAKFLRYPSAYYQIKNKEVVPLTGKRESFVDVARIVYLIIDEFSNVKRQALNYLSEEDSVNLINHFNAYHS